MNPFEGCSLEVQSYSLEIHKQIGNDGEKLRGYVDSDFAGDLDKQRSLTGYIFTLFGCIVSWKAQLQLVVALSTTEAEYIATIEVSKKPCG